MIWYFQTCLQDRLGFKIYMLFPQILLLCPNMELYLSRGCKYEIPLFLMWTKQVSAPAGNFIQKQIWSASCALNPGHWLERPVSSWLPGLYPGIGQLDYRGMSVKNGPGRSFRWEAYASHTFRTGDLPQFETFSANALREAERVSSSGRPLRPHNASWVVK